MAARTGRISQSLALTAVIVVVAVAVAVITSPSSARAAIRDAFSPPVFATQDNGAITLIGNSQMSCPVATNGCSTARNAAPISSGTDDSINNEYNQAFLDLDGIAGTTNSTSADLALPAGSVVLFAKLVWGGRRDAGTGGSAAGANFNQVGLRLPGSTTYTTVTSTNTVAPDLSGTDGHPYQASIDVTSQVTAGGNGTYWVANIQAGTGQDRYAGWSLVVAYRNPSLPLRDLSVFEGFADVTTTTGNSSVTIPVSGFLTPATGTVNASVGFVVWEGDRGLTGEQVLLNGSQLSDASRPTTNFFNSGITNAGANITARNANYPNNFGVDIANVVANGVLPNSATSTNLVLTTNREFYYPGIVTTQIDLFTPAFNAVAKTVTNLSGHSPAQVGDTLQYQLSFTNTGADPADNVVVSDVLAANQTYVPGSINVIASPGNANNGSKTDAVGDDIGEYVAGSRTVRVRVGTGASAAAGGALDTNATATLRFNVTLDRASAGTNVDNSAQLSYRARTLAKNYTFTTNVVTTPVAPIADLSVAKTSSPTSVVAGGTVQYPITVTNNGPNTATGVSVVDTLPAGVTFGNVAAPPGASCSTSGQVVTCTAATLANGASLTFTVTATIPAASTATSVVNTVRVASATSDDVATNDSASATTTITRAADVVATKSGPSGTTNAGGQISYSIAARNDGPSNATTVRLTDPIPVGTTFAGVTPTGSPLGTCAQDGGSVVCTIATLAPGQSMAATVLLNVGSGFSASSLTNTVSATSAVTDPTPANNSASVTSTIGLSADVALTKTVSPTTANAGSGVTYTLTVTNNGPSDAQAVTVSDPDVVGIIATSAASSRGTCTLNASADVACAIGLLSPGSSATITVQATVDSDFAGASVLNTAATASTTADPTPGNNSATATLAVTRSADVSIVKTGPATITASANSTYTLTIANAGPSQATGVVATDVLPAGLTFVSSATGCTAAGTTVTCPVGTLARNASSTRTFVVLAAADVAATVANTATVSAATTDPNGANNSSTFTSSGTNVADVAISKAITPATLVAGGPITYTMVVRNNGPSTAQGVSVTDTVPAGVTITTVTTTAGTCNPAPAIQCAIGTMSSGATATVTATGTIGSSAAAGTTLANTATASSTSPTDPTTSNNSASASGTVTTSADVGVTLTANQPTIVAGAIEDYTLHIVNNGPSLAQNVVATGQVPPGLVPIIGSSGGACVLTDQIVTCRLGALPAGAVLDIPLRATVDPSNPPGPISGTAFIGSDTPDAVSANNQSTAIITVVTSADLVMTKTAPATLVAGGEATYTLTVVNNGLSDAANVTVSDTLPSGLTLVSASASQGSCTPTGSTVNCTTTRLPAGSSIVVSIKVNVGTGAASPVGNTATVSAATTDPNTSNNSSTTSTPVTQAAHVTVSKAVESSPAVAGASITYTLTVANSGPSNAANVVLTDNLPPGVLVLPGALTSPAGGSCTVNGDSAGFGCTFAQIPAGQSRIVTVTASVPAAAAAGSDITNTATITSDTPDPDPSGHTASVTTPVTTSADVVMLKTPLDNAVDAGDRHGYLLTVSNGGPSVARAVTVSDPLPAGTTFVDATSTNGTCTSAGGVVSCAIGDLDPGRVATVQLTVLLAANLGDTTLTNAATAATTTPDPNTANNISTVAQRVTRRADLRLTKAIASGDIVAGSPLTYALTLSNAGPSDTVDAFIVDPIPTGTAFSSASASDDGTCALAPADPNTVPPTPTQVRCAWPQLVVGATRTATITVAVPDAAAAGTLVSNTATADSVATDPTPATATADGNVVARSDVSLTKTLISGSAVAGGTVRWQLVARNAGPSTATGVTIADIAPAGVTFSAVSATAGTCAVGASPLCTLGTIPVGGTVTVTLTGALDADYADPEVTNSATIASTSSDPVTGNNTASSTTAVDTSADLDVVKTASQSTFVAGSTAQWTVTATNNGPSASRSVVVTDPVPVGLVNVTATSSGAVACTVGATVSCPFALIPVGGSATVTIAGTITPDFAAGNLTNTARATAGTPDPDPTNNFGSVTTTVGTSADVRIAKSGPAAGAPGEQIIWQLTVDNAGPSVAQGVVITDQLPAGLIAPRATFAGTPCSVVADVVTCQLGAVPVSDGTSETSQIVVITATIDPASTLASLTNTAVVSASTTDPNAGNNSASTATTLSPRSDLSITKVNDATTIVPGTSTTWAITASNAGPSVARDVVVTDVLPAGATPDSAQLVVGATRSVCAISAQTVTCTIGAVTPGVPARIEVVARVDQGLTASVLSNTATVTSSTADPTPDDDSSTSNTPVLAAADVRVTKSVDLTGGPPVAGGPVRFLIGVRNSGPSAAQAVVVDDVLPASLDPASVTVTPSACAYTEATAAIQCPLGVLNAGDAVQIVVEATSLATATDVTNTATVGSATNDPVLANNSSTATAVSSQLADMEIVKTGPIDVVAGNRISWTLTATNNGLSVADGVTVVDALPAGVTDVQVTAPAGTSCTTTSSVSCTVAATMGVDDSVVITISALVPSGSHLTSLTNSATISAATPDPDGANNATSVTSAVRREAQLAVTKVADPSPFVPGRDATYTVVVTNDGPSDAEATLAADVLDPILIPSGAPVASQGGCAYTGAVLNCSLGVVPAGGLATVRIPVRVDPAATASSVTNTASASSSTPAVDPSVPPVGTATSAVTPLADLTLTKTGPATVVAGTPISWTLDLTNDGPSVAGDVVITDTLPPGLGAMTIVPSQGTCTRAGETITCAVGAMAPGTSATVQISGAVPADSTATSLVNSATVASPAGEPDGGTGGRSATTTTAVQTVADIAVSKRFDTAAAVPGRTVQWTVTVGNFGPSVGRDVVVTETLPAGLTGVAFTPPSGVTCSAATATCQIAALPVGAANAVAIVITANLPADATAALNNSVAVSALTTDPDPGNNQASTTTVLSPQADLTVTKTGPASVVRGTTVTWTVTVGNDGPSVANDVVVTDLVPAGVTGVSVTGVSAGGAPPGTCTAEVVCTFATFAPTDPDVVLTITGTVAADLATDSLVNTATIAGATPDPDPDDNSSTATTTVVSRVALVWTKTGPATVIAGGAISWTIIVRNDGPSVARDVVVDDSVPAGVLGVGAQSSVGSCDATVRCELGTLPVGVDVTVTVAGTVDPSVDAGRLTNAVTVTSTDPVQPTAPPPVVTEVTRSADVSITKALVGELVAGGTATWSIVVANAGPSTAADVVVTDPLPAALLAPSATTSAGSCSIAGSTLTCAVGTVVPGAPVTITVSGTVPAGFTGTMTNTASVSSGTPDPNPDNTVSSADAPVERVIDLAITKSVDRPEGLMGSTATFTIVASNLGPSTATSVVVDDQLPAGLTFVAARPSAGTFDATTRRWAIGTLVVGDSVTMQIDVTLAALGPQTNVATIGQMAPGTLAITPTGDEEIRLDNNAASATILVVASGGDLPATGFDVGEAGVIALVALAGGAALVLVARRRRRLRAG